MYNYRDKIEILTNGDVQYDNNGYPVFSEGQFEFLSDCRLEENNSYTLGGTYVYSFNVYLPKSFDASKLPGKDTTVRLTKKDMTVNGIITTVKDSRSTPFNYLIKT